MSRKPDVTIATGDVIGNVALRKILVGGSRTFGVCPHEPKHREFIDSCSVREAHRGIMVRAFHEHGLWTCPRPIALYEGDAEGADRLSAQIWTEWRLGPVVAYPANWDELGKRAGHVRNGILVAHMPDLALFFHLDNSPGTADAIAQSRKAGLNVHVYPKEK